MRKLELEIKAEREAEMSRITKNHKEELGHSIMELKSDEKSDHLVLLQNEITLAQNNSDGYFESNALHDSFDLRSSGTEVLSNLRRAIVNETSRMAQLKILHDWYNALAERETAKWGRGWERYYKMTPQEQINAETMKMKVLPEHFPEDTLPTAGRSIFFQGKFRDFADGLRSSLTEWKFMMRQNWISHGQYIQWIVKGAIFNLDQEEKKLIAWQILKEELDENTMAEIAVAVSHHLLKKQLGSTRDLHRFCNM